MVNVYEPNDAGVEELVYRPMNDEEYEIWLAHVPALVEPEVKPPMVLELVRELSPEELDELRALLA